jgi:hypothetical protein
MGSPIDRAAYATEFEIFDQALASERGMQVPKKTEAEAYKLRERLNSARALDRELNRRIFRENPDDPRYGSSEYAALVIKIVEDVQRGRWLCRLEKGKIEEMEIEEIPPPEEEEEDGTEGSD